jgi:hypothetical protein
MIKMELAPGTWFKSTAQLRSERLYNEQQEKLAEERKLLREQEAATQETTSGEDTVMRFNKLAESLKKSIDRD